MLVVDSDKRESIVEVLKILVVTTKVLVRMEIMNMGGFDAAPI